MNRRRAFILAGMAALCLHIGARAGEEAPDALVKRVSAEVADAVRASPADAADERKLRALVDTTIMPSVNFERMTAAAVGRSWPQATPEQRKRLEEGFKVLLVRTYAGALTHLKNQVITVKPLRANLDDAEVTVKTLVKGGGEPVAIDYRMEKTATGWKIIDLNVMGVWLVPTYRGQFSAEIDAHGVDGLIAMLDERNRIVARAN